MVQIIWTKRAITDLDSVGKYIVIDSENAAQKFVQELIKKADSLINSVFGQEFLRGVYLRR